MSAMPGGAGGGSLGARGGREIGKILRPEVRVAASNQLQVAVQHALPVQIAHGHNLGLELLVTSEQGHRRGCGENFGVRGGPEELRLVQAVDQSAVQVGDQDAPVVAGDRWGC